MGDASNVICSDMQHVTTSLTDMSRWQYIYDLYDPMYIVYSIYIHTSLQIYTNWWYTYPSEKYESQLGLLCPIYGKIKNVPNHQAEWEFQDPKIEVR